MKINEKKAIVLLKLVSTTKKPSEKIQMAFYRSMYF